MQDMSSTPDPDLSLDGDIELEAIIDAAVEHTYAIFDASERDDTDAAAEAQRRLEAIIPDDNDEVRDLLDMAVDMLAVERAMVEELEDAVEHAGSHSGWNLLRAGAVGVLSGIFVVSIGGFFASLFS